MSAVDPVLVEAWAKGWAYARGAPLPTRAGEAWLIRVGLPDQESRAIFAGPSPDIAALAARVRRPHNWIKMFGETDSLAPLLDSRWQIQPEAWSMTLAPGRWPARTELPAGYAIDAKEGLTRCEVRILDEGGALAASGAVAVVAGHAIHDQIVTQEAHRRRGLGRRLMAELAVRARLRGAERGLLTATPLGKSLYEALGWTVASPYTGAVIAG